MDGTTAKKILALFMGLSLLILSLSVGFYFVYYIPKSERTRLEEESEREKTKMILEQKFKEDKKYDYKDCLAKAERDFRDNWLHRCEANGIPIKIKTNGTASCTLPDTWSQVVRDEYEKDKDRCFQVFEKE